MNDVMKREEWNAQYLEKRKTPAQAAAMLFDGAVCASDIAASQAYSFYEAVAALIRAGELNHITQHSLLDTANAPFFTEPLFQKYQGVSWFSSGFGNKSVNAGFCDVMPAYYRDIPGLFANEIHPDVFVAVVAPMDRHGYFSTGTSASVTYGQLENAKQIFLEVNPNMPRALTGPQIHVSKVTALWENDAPIVTLESKPIDPISQQIGEIIAEEIPDGATLQMGIGAIPDAVGLALRGKHNLGFHTEMFTNSMIELLACGAADNSRKPIHTGKTVATFALGSSKMYDYIHDNPGVEMLPVNYVNDPAVIAQHPNFVSVNSAIEVDFFGQVCAESIGTRHVSGTGGHSDFVRGAIQSNGGKSFIAFNATANGGASSKIVSALTPGAQISTSKNDVDMIVTEYGIAKLRGRTLSQRTKALIGIADPKFREMLTFDAKKRNIII